MKLKIFISVALLLVSGFAFSSTNCVVTPNTDFRVELNTININPGAQTGDIVGQSEIVERDILCQYSTTPEYDRILAYYDGRSNVGTGIFVNVQYPGTSEVSTCEAMESGYPGLGIVWFNYNTANTSRWLCASMPEDSATPKILGRRLLSGTKRSIKDQIFLVKTGDITSENFNFNRSYLFEERTNSSNYLPDFGPLYTVILSGETRIESPKCTASSTSESQKYLTLDISNNSVNEISQNIDILCTGYIEDGTIVPFRFKTDHGLFVQNNQYYASSTEGLGVNVKYKTGTDTSFTKLVPSSNAIINVPIFSGRSILNFNIEPYIENNSGVYPLEEYVNFNINIVAGDDN